MSKLKARLPEDLKDKLNEVVEEYARTADPNNEMDAQTLFSRIANDLRSSDNEIRAAGENAAVKTIAELMPRIFIQMVENRSVDGDMESQLNEDFYGELDEGNGAEFYSNLIGAPTHTQAITNLTSNFVPTNVTAGYNQSWKITYMRDDNSLRLSNDAYAFHQVITIQPQIVLPAFRSGAGYNLLISITETLYNSLLFTQYNFWAKKKFTLPTDNTVNGRNLVHQGTGANGFDCWLEISEIIRKMTKVTNAYNYNGAFKRPSGTRLNKIRIYVSSKTMTTYENNLQSQLYNNAKFVKTIEPTKMSCLEFKAKWQNITNANITIPNKDGAATVVQPNALTDPTYDTAGIPEGLVWTFTTEEIIPDNQVWITTDDSFRWIRQTKLSNSQDWAYNNTKMIMTYELGAMSWDPTGKLVVYQSDNLNVNPTNAG